MNPSHQLTVSLLCDIFYRFGFGLTFRNQLTLPVPTDPLTWEIRTSTEKVKFSSVSTRLSKVQNIFFDIGFNCTSGERKYISFAAACEHVSENRTSEQLEFFSEELVNSLRACGLARILVAVDETQATKQGNTFREKLIKESSTFVPTRSNFTIIEELGFGSNKVFLSNHHVVQSWIPENQEIFGKFGAIINCHQTKEHSEMNPYQYEACQIYCFPVHALHTSEPGILEKVFTDFNENIWEGLQKGNVLIHCAAGHHRAAAVVVSHFLYRRLKLGHREIGSDIDHIYQSLKERRRGVHSLGYGDLVRKYKEFLLKQN